MKRILLLLSLICGFNSAQAQFTSPNLGLNFTMSDLLLAGAVTQSGGEYLVNQALTLETTDTLTINTNETIKVGTGHLLTIKGTLLINPPDSVKITAINPANKFHTLKFDGGTTVSRVRKLVLEHSSGIRVLNARVVIDSCIVRYNDRVNQSGAIYVSGQQRVVITNSRIYRNSRAGIMSPTNGANLVIRNNWLFQNGVEPGLYPAINLGPASTDSVIITGNTIIGINATTNRSGGIAVSNLLGSSSITKVLIEKNTIQQNSYGITITGGNIHGHIKRNLIEGNKVNPNANAGGSGINFNTTTTNQLVVAARNIIRDNLWGVTIQSGANVGSGPRPSLGRIGSPDTANVGLNQIYNNFNNGSSGQIWDLYNNTTDSVYAENNYWGTTNLADIEDHIFHKTDNPAHGFVDYLPLFQQPVSGLADNRAKAALSLYPNPAGNVVSLKANGTFLSQKTALRLFNTLGQEVLQTNVSANGTINVAALPAGLYSYRIEHDGVVTVGKLLIAR